jgi:DNA-directed RNA polymerase specialized sigma24 family protein
MARLDWMDRELNNWARWCIASTQGGGNYARVGTFERVDCDGHDAPAIIRIDDAEAAIIDAGIKTLEPDLQSALHLHYVDNQGLASKLRRAGCTERTFYVRIERAQHRLAAWMADRKAAAKAEQARVAALSVAATAR